MHPCLVAQQLEVLSLFVYALAQGRRHLTHSTRSVLKHAGACYERALGTQGVVPLQRLDGLLLRLGGVGQECRHANVRFGLVVKQFGFLDYSHGERPVDLVFLQGR